MRATVSFFTIKLNTIMNENKYKPCDLVIYGALGDLSRRKLMMSLYQLDKASFLEPQTRILAVDRLAKTREELVKIVRESLEEFLPCPIVEEAWARFSARCPPGRAHRVRSARPLRVWRSSRQ